MFSALDTRDLIHLVETKAMSSEELVQEAIKAIEEKNPSINAVVSKRYEAALTEARQKDFGKCIYPGIPILLKDLGQEQEGQPSTSGAKLFQDYRASKSDNFVKAIEQAGFIVLGRTNTPEYGFKNISDSQLHGAVNLPDDVTRNAGGSSGGAAAAVASGMVTIATASDGGGSIRIPASFNGLIGLKPSRGRLPVGPDSFRGWQGASSQFAMTKSVRDTIDFFKAMQVYQVESPFPLQRIEEESICQKEGKLRIAVMRQSPIQTEVSAEAEAALEDMIGRLEQLGHQVKEVDLLFDGIELMQSYYVMNGVETAAMFKGIEAAQGRLMTPDDMELMTWGIYRSGLKIPAYDYSRLLTKWDQYAAKMHDFFKDYDLILTPTTNGVAPKHHQFLLSDPLKQDLLEMDRFESQKQQDLIWEMFAESLAWTPFTQWANLTGQPAISLPTYRTADGLSLGVQFMAAKGREDRLLSLALELENEQTV